MARRACTCILSVFAIDLSHKSHNVPIRNRDVHIRAHFCYKMVYMYSGIFVRRIVGFVRWVSLRWRHNERDGVSHHQPHHWLLSCLFRRRSKKTSKLRVTGLCEGNSPVTGEFPAQRASNADHISIWWRHHIITQQQALSAKLASTVNMMKLKSSESNYT